MDCRWYYCFLLFSNYRARDFGTVKMRSSSHSKIVDMRDMCLEINVACRLALRDMRHVPDLRLNLIFGFALSKGSLIAAKGNVC